MNDPLGLLNGRTADLVSWYKGPAEFVEVCTRLAEKAEDILHIFVLDRTDSLTISQLLADNPQYKSASVAAFSIKSYDSYDEFVAWYTSALDSIDAETTRNFVHSMRAGFPDDKSHIN